MSAKAARQQRLTQRLAQQAKTPKPPAEPIKLTEHEAGYFRVVAGQKQAAMANMEHAMALEQQIEQLRQQATALLGAHDSYLLHLFGTYGVDPERAQVQLQPDGSCVIVTATQESA